MSKEEGKQRAAEAALKWLNETRILGIGTGTTVAHFLDALAPVRARIEGAVSSSEATTARLREIGIPVLDLNTTGDIEVYVDGADRADRHLHLVKGGGGALTREKIIAAASRKFICIIDESKLVENFNDSVVPIEVIPMARSFVARQIVMMGARPVWREKYVTDNGNAILDIRGLKLTNPVEVEEKINNIPGVVAVGIFARKPADVLLVGNGSEVKTIKA